MQTDAITAVVGLCLTAAAAIGRGVVSLHGRQKRKHKTAKKIAALRAAVVADERSAVVTGICLSIVDAIETSKTPADVAAKYTGSMYEHAFVRRLAGECSTVAQLAGVMSATVHALQTTLLCEREREVSLERCVSGGTSTRTTEFQDHVARLHLSASTLTLSRYSMTVLDASPDCDVRGGSRLTSSLDARNEDENNIALALMRNWEPSDVSEPVKLWLLGPDSRGGSPVRTRTRGDRTPPRTRHTDVDPYRMGCASPRRSRRARAHTDPVYAYLLCSSDTDVTVALMRDPDLSDLPASVFRRDWAFALLVDESEDTIVSATSTGKNAGFIVGAIGQTAASLMGRFVGTLTRYSVHRAGTAVLVASLHKVTGRVVGGQHERPRVEHAERARLVRDVSEPEHGGEM